MARSANVNRLSGRLPRRRPVLGVFAVIALSHLVLSVASFAFWWDRAWRAAPVTLADRTAHALSRVLLFPLAHRFDALAVGLVLNSLLWGIVLTLGVVALQRRNRDASGGTGAG